MTTEQILEIVKQWLPVLMSLIMLIVSFISKINAKKISKSQVFYNLIARLPDLITIAENKGFKTGADKLNYVVELASILISNNLAISVDEAQEIYGDSIIEQVEAILATPEKKEAIK